jgi:hypothetical protein
MPGAGWGILRTWTPASARTAAYAPRRSGRALPADWRRPGSSRAGRRCRLRARAGRAHHGSPLGTALPAGRVLPARAPAAARSWTRSADWACWWSMAMPTWIRAADRPGRTCARRVRHPGDRGGQIQVPHGYPRGDGRARIGGAPPVHHRGRDARRRRRGLVRRMTGRYRLPDALRRADTLARVGPPAVNTTDRQPGRSRPTRGTRHDRTFIPRWVLHRHAVEPMVHWL